MDSRSGPRCERDRAGGICYGLPNPASLNTPSRGEKLMMSQPADSGAPARSGSLGGYVPPLPPLLPNLFAAGRLAARKPQILSVAAHNVSYRVIHRALRSRSRGWTLPPEQVTVVATDICNLRCKMCQYAFSEDPSYELNRMGKLPFTLFKKVMDEIPGRPLVTFTGGEPLINTAVPDFIAYAKQKGRFCTLTTNGWFLADHARALSEAGLDILIVSVDGPPDVHDRIRGPRSFERLTKGIETILREPNRPLVMISTPTTTNAPTCSWRTRSPGPSCPTGSTRRLSPTRWNAHARVGSATDSSSWKAPS